MYGQVAGTCERAFEAKFQHGGQINIRVRSGDIEVAGSDAALLRVTCELKRNDEAKNISIKFKATGSSGDLRILGGPNNDVHIRIEVPKNSNLFLRSPAGDLSVSGITGDKDVEIHAGDLTISVGNPADYKHADASVYAGDLSASAFGVTKDGLFRSFDKDNASGRYRLHAHVGAGDLVLK
ncbi:MAG TPA: hypothetical protein VMT32_03310 [Bryobacteraceae bacterium]|nr:hypothetical protein [Bryobacteraceae bacterium]